MNLLSFLLFFSASTVIAQKSTFSIQSPACTTKAATDAVYKDSGTCEQHGGVTVKSKSIAHQKALFGLPPYTGSMSGKIYYGTEGDRDACEAYPKPTPWSDNAQKMPIILLIDRGDCTFVQKVRNAQNEAANAVIVVDNVEEGYLPVMADDGSGKDISIPSVLISKKDGQLIKDALADGQVVRGELSWDLPAPDNRVEWSFWTSANDATSIDFVEQFKDAYVALGKDAEMTPNYLIIDGKTFDCHTESQPCKKQCTHNGLYCAEDPENDFNQGLDGEDIVLENLRQLCIWQELKKVGTEVKWWDYVSLFANNCKLDKDFNANCSKNQQLAAKMTTSEVDAIRKCVTGSENADGTNSLLEQQLKNRDEDGIFILPTVMINDVKYRGRLSCPHPIWRESCGVLGQICNGFSDKSVAKACQADYCWKTKDECGDCRDGPDDPKWNKNCTEPYSATGIVVPFVLVLVVLGGATLWYIKRKERRMKNYVENIVANYMPLQDNVANPQSQFSGRGDKDTSQMLRTVQLSNNQEV